MESETLAKSGHGPNVRWWREYKNMTQDTLAELSGYSQPAICAYEKEEKLKPDVLNKIAKALEIPVEAITELRRDSNVNIISGTWNDNASAIASQYYPNFNPLDKVVELFKEKEDLYERMLKEKDNTIELLHNVFKDKM